MADWSTRIPAAIEKAERILGRRETAECVGEGAVFIPRDSPDRTITRNEVAMAKALWDMTLLLLHGKPPSNIALVPPTLIAFTEKVEAL